MRTEHPDASKIPGLKSLWQRVFGDSDAFLDTFFTVAFARERCRCIITEDRPVAALYWLDMEYSAGKLAYIYAVATDPAFRGQGLCRRLMTDTHALLRAEGYAGAVLVPEGAGLFRMYENMGYVRSSGIRELPATAADPAVQLRNLQPEEYQQLRERYLAPEDIRLSPAALEFLAQDAGFCAGGDFVLAYTRNGSTLRGLELLGNAGAAPGILAALDCERGHFRTPGNERDFAMFLPLGENTAAPGHLGFAFD